MGGTGALVNGLVRKFETGGTLICEAEVAKIDTQRGTVPKAKSNRRDSH